MKLAECGTCHRMWNDTDNTGVCPIGHENSWDDDELEHQQHLRKVTW